MIVDDNNSSDTTSRNNVFSTVFTSMGSACSCDSNPSIAMVCWIILSADLEILESSHKTPLWFQEKTPQEWNSTWGQTIYEEDDPLFNWMYTYQYSSINTSNPISYLQLSQVIFDEINAARVWPKVIKETIDYDITLFNSSNSNQLWINNQTWKTYVEGKSAFVEASNYLANASMISSLIWTDGLANACMDLMTANSGCGEPGHMGLDGSTIFSRMQKYFYYDGAYKVNESLSYDPSDGKDAVESLIIDDGVPNRTNRTNIFNSNYTHIGIVCGWTNHFKYKTMCCIELSSGQTSKSGVTAEAISTKIVGSDTCANCSVSIYKKPT